MARATWIDNYTCTHVHGNFVVDHIFCSAQMPFRFYTSFVECWIILTALNSKIPNPRHIQSSACIWSNERDTGTDTKMGDVNMNHEHKLLYNQTNKITFNLDSIECTSLRISDVCGLVCDVRKMKIGKWEKIFLDSFHRHKHLKTRKV